MEINPALAEPEALTIALGQRPNPEAENGLKISLKHRQELDGIIAKAADGHLCALEKSEFVQRAEVNAPAPETKGQSKWPPATTMFGKFVSDDQSFYQYASIFELLEEFERKKQAKERGMARGMGM